MNEILDLLHLAISFLACAALAAFTLLCIVLIVYVIMEVWNGQIHKSA